MIVRLEELALNAWPALQQVHYDGWILRFANGYTRRSNSVNPLYPGEYALEQKIDYCKALYRRRGLPAVYKISPGVFPAELDEVLAQRGYLKDALTSVQCLPFHHIRFSPAADLVLTDSPTPEWLDRYCGLRLSARDEVAVLTCRQILNAIVPSQCFAALVKEGRMVSLGLAVMDGPFVGLFNVITEAAERNKGCGRAVVEGLLAWAAARGAQQAYLQVMANNAPALHLYSALGFKEVYQYWYRVKN